MHVYAGVYRIERPPGCEQCKDGREYTNARRGNDHVYLREIVNAGDRGRDDKLAPGKSKVSDDRAQNIQRNEYVRGWICVVRG